MTDLTKLGLYAITDESLMGSHFADAVEQCLQGGCRIIQYRDKSSDTAKRLQQAGLMRELCDLYNSLLIINDDINLALQSRADGVHIGKEDSHLKQARQQLGSDKIIGVSCYNQLQLALEAEQEGADYVAFGAFFSSSIKPDATRASVELLQQAKQQLNTPICCIGGITVENAPTLVEAGSDMIAVISNVFAHSPQDQSIEQASLRLSQLFSA